METIIETANIRAVKNAVRSAVNRNGLMTVVAEVGSGKTTMFNYLADWWMQHPDKFKVVTVKSFDSRYTKIGMLMQFLLEAMSPETKVPRGNENRYKLLETQLRKYSRKNFKIILMIDEAQDLITQTFYDIKKIHEISGNDMEHLFSVILFGKNSRKWDALIGKPELGYRMDVTFMEPLTEEEIVKIAEARYNIDFESDKVRRRFCSVLEYKTPLGIQFFCEALKREMGAGLNESVFINADLVIKIPMITKKIRLKQAGKTQAQLAEYCRNNSERKINPQRISEFFNGKMQSDDPLYDELLRLSEQYIADAHSSRRKRLYSMA